MFTGLQVEFERDGWVMVQDDGRGIPTDTHSRTGKSALETVLTVRAHIIKKNLETLSILI